MTTSHCTVQGKQLTWWSAGEEDLGEDTSQVHVAKSSGKNRQCAGGAKVHDQGGSDEGERKVENTVGHPGEKILEGGGCLGEKLRDVAAVEDVFKSREDRGEDMGSPFGGDESTAIEEDQPGCDGEEGQHELAGLFRDQKANGAESDREFEPDGLVHDVIAEGEEGKEEHVLEVVEGVVVFLEWLDSGDNKGL